MSPKSAILLLSFGGPERPEDVIPFLENVTAGRGVPPERLEQVAQQYQKFGGRSPINDQNRELLAKLQAEVDSRGDLGAGPMRVYWGNRNWDPFLADTLREIVADGVEQLYVLVTSGYSSYSSCRQYREDLAAAMSELAVAGLGEQLVINKIRRWSDHPAVIDVLVDNVDQAIDQLREQSGLPSSVRLVFTTHSIPEYQVVSSRAANADGDQPWGYVEQHEFVAREVARRVSERKLGSEGAFAWDLVYQSRSGPPQQPWLEPDVNDYLAEVPAAGATAVVVTPIGFASDHMEVKWDLDTEAAATARDLGLDFARAATVGADDRFVSALIDMVAERVNAVAPEQRPSLAPAGAAPDLCPANCCLGRGEPRAALCGVTSETEEGVQL